MAGFNGLILTKKGIALLSKIQQGGSITFTRMAVGDGSLAVGQDEKMLTGLVHYLKDVPIGKVERVSDDTTVIRGVLSNAGITKGFVIREIGIFAMDPDEGEILHSYTNAGDEPDYIPVPGKVTAEEFIEAYTIVGQAATVNMTIDPSIVFLTQVDMDNHINNKDPHQKWLRIGARVDDCADVWVSSIGETTPVPTIRPMAFDSFKRLILGGDASTLPVLAAQNDALFREVANIALFMQASQTYPDYNKLIAENFTPVTEVDITSITITSIAAGSNSIGVATLTGIVEGAWYNVSDGVLQELVQCTGLTQNGSTLRMQTAQPVVNTYNMATAMLYRSTTMIQTGQVGQLWSGQAQGAGNQTSSTWQPTLTWTGTAANAPVAAALITTQANAASFTLSGNAGFDANGNATLV